MLKILVQWILRKRLCSFGAPPGSHSPVLEAHPSGRTPFHPPRIAGLGNRALLVGPSASRNTFSVSTITDGNARVRGRSTLSSWLYIEPSPCGRVRPAGDPVDSDRPEPSSRTIPTPDSDAGRPLEPWVCRRTRKPTILSRLRLPPTSPEFCPFSPALPVTLAHGHLSGWEQRSMDKWGLSSPYHVAGHLPLRAARLFLLCVSLEVFATPTRRYRRQDV